MYYLGHENITKWCSSDASIIQLILRNTQTQFVSRTSRAPSNWVDIPELLYIDLVVCTDKSTHLKWNMLVLLTNKGSVWSAA